MLSFVLLPPQRNGYELNSKHLVRTELSLTLSSVGLIDHRRTLPQTMADQRDYRTTEGGATGLILQWGFLGPAGIMNNGDWGELDSWE